MKYLLALSLLLASLPAHAQRVPVEGKHGIFLEEKGGKTLLHTPGGTISIGRGELCAPCRLQTTRLLGEQGKAALVILVTYASRPNSPTGMCGAGEEEVLHVIRLKPRPQEALAVPLASCWSNIEPAGEPVWDARRNMLTTERWTLESSTTPERSRWRVAADGRVTAVPNKQR